MTAAMFVEARTCSLCGRSSTTDVAIALTRWSDPIDGRRFEAMPRCRDRAACRARVLANGERWPVDDGERIR
jgi:hypothetical protein